MTVADYKTVGEVALAAWRTSCESEEGFRWQAISEAARSGFFAYPTEAKGDVVVAELARRLVGWGAREGDRDCISDVWVDPAHQGNGIGSALVRHFLNQIAEEGYAVARIHTRATNVGAIRLYERLGSSVVWRGTEFNAALKIPLEKVHLERRLDQPG
jgi:ribosomal-protein-alanine N-acetyltransferase